jgi:hypothetical protein
MPKIRTVSTVTLPKGSPRFPDVTPALKEALQVKIAQGKATLLPQTVVDHSNGWTTTTTTNIWNNKSDYEAFKNFFESTYRMLQDEYYHPFHTSRPADVVTAYPLYTVTEEE